MARTTPPPISTATRTLQPLGRHCPLCGETMWMASHNYRPLTTLAEVWPLPLPMRRCLTRPWPQCRRPYRPAEAGRLAWPKPELGLDVSAWGGTRRDAPHRSLPDIPQPLLPPGVVAPRPVPKRLERYDAWLALSLPDTARLQPSTHTRGRGSLALDGRQPDVGPEVLWGLRACRSGAVLLARR